MARKYVRLLGGKVAHVRKEMNSAYYLDDSLCGLDLHGGDTPIGEKKAKEFGLCKVCERRLKTKKK